MNELQFMRTYCDEYEQRNIPDEDVEVVNEFISRHKVGISVFVDLCEYEVERTYRMMKDASIVLKHAMCRNVYTKFKKLLTRATTYGDMLGRV